MTPRPLVGALALALAACGAKTGLDTRARDGGPLDAVPLDGGPLDAGPLDAGSFHSFPCRWFPDVFRDLPLGRVDAAAVNAELERIVLVGPGPDAAGTRWVSYFPRATPVLEDSVTLPWAAGTRSIVPRRGGWLVAASDGAASCELHWVSREVEVERTERLDTVSGQCELEPVDLDRAVLRRAVSPTAIAVELLDTADGARRELARAPEQLVATQATDGTSYVVVADGTAWEGRALTPDGRTLTARWPRLGAAARAQLAPDRLLDGAILVTEAGAEVVVDRLRIEDDALVRVPLATTAGPLGLLDLETNETEALFSLASGAFVAIPVHSGDVRVFDPPTGPVADARLVIAPGQSVAVQVWHAGDGLPRMRALVCNR